MMRIVKNPAKEEWYKLCKRPSDSNREIENSVSAILLSVREGGDNAMFEYCRKFDGANISDLTVKKEEFVAAEKLIDESLRKAIDTAYINIFAFHTSQVDEIKVTETMPGVRCWRKSLPVEKVGLYIPGGTAPLFSTVLMLAIPAVIAGCNDIIICTPPSRDGSINPAILYCAGKCGIKRVYKAGGAQAIAAMAYGTETITPVYKIFGPGNQYVTKAKELVRREGIEIDMPAGPSEVLVIADKSANPAFVAADLLSQAEHGTDSQVILLSTSRSFIDNVLIEIKNQISNLPRKDIAAESLNKSLAIEFDSADQCIEFSNMYAPEHLIINTYEPAILSEGITSAGSVFIGSYSCESAGDYASGTNHTLPTSGYAKVMGGVSADSFVKKVTFQEISKTGLKNLADSICTMAEAESLMAHSNAVTIRIKNL